ncbi:globin domain-containing protein [Streptomyces sp. YIM S03343]
MSGADYHALLARREAMRFRDQLLTPGARVGGSGGLRSAVVGVPEGSYDSVRDQEIITRDLHLLMPFGELIDELYAALFHRHPYLRQLFPDSMEFQRGHLERAFRYLIEHLDRPAELAAFCARLGRDHRKLGVLPVHYGVFEQALAEALQRRSRGRLDVEVTRAWLRMVRLAAAAMVDGASEAVGEPAYWGATVTEHQRRRPDLAVIRVRPFEPYPFLPGQYATVETPLVPNTWRPYSPAGLPSPDGELEFHVRRTGPGGVSDALVTGTRVGDTLRLGPARGNTVLDDSRARDVLVIAGGTGWAGARALVEDLALRRGPGVSAHLFLGVRSADDLYDGSVLTRLESRCPWLRIVPVADDAGSGSVRGSVVETMAAHGDWTGHAAYVSGPPGLVIAAVRRLAGLGVPADRIRHDPVPAGG